MEIVLGVDNIVFIAIVAGSLPPERQEVARRLGLVMALGMRLLLLLTLSWVLGLTRPVFALSDLGVPANTRPSAVPNCSRSARTVEVPIRVPERSSSCDRDLVFPAVASR
jgi:hypothetical protein